jgi:hypothetical protein
MKMGLRVLMFGVFLCGFSTVAMAESCDRFSGPSRAYTSSEDGTQYGTCKDWEHPVPECDCSTSGPTTGRVCFISSCQCTLECPAGQSLDEPNCVCVKDAVSVDCTLPSDTNTCGSSASYGQVIPDGAPYECSNQDYDHGGEAPFRCQKSVGTCQGDPSQSGSSFPGTGITYAINPTGPCGTGPVVVPTSAPPSTPPPSGTTTGGSTTGGSTTGSTTGAPSASPASTPHVACPGDSTADLSAWDNCNCTVGGAKFNSSTLTCACPTDYEKVMISSGNIECRPTLTSEFFRNAASNQFPVCGDGRIPVKDVGGSWVPLKAASNGVPNSNDKVTSGSFDYLYATGVATAPNYLYKNYPHCACTARAVPSGTATGTGATDASQLVGSSNVARFPMDSSAIIKLQTTTNNVMYAPVTIAKNENVDGRKGTLFNSGYSQCECPNLNESFSQVDAGGDPMGSVCTPTVTDTTYRVLTPFNPKFHDQPGHSQVMNRSSAQTSNGSDLVTAVTLGNGSNGTEKYTRRIWTCMDPLRVNASTGACQFVEANNTCDAGNNADVEASAVSDSVTGTTDAERFMNAKNKKLACCMNQFNRNSTGQQKFDCVQTTDKTYKDFDALWSSADNSAQGGQLNAIMLTNSQGKDVSGFYTLTGSRCQEFSEFAGDIQPGLVNSALGVGAQAKRANGKLDKNSFEAKGSTIKLPGSGTGDGSAAYSFIQGKVTGGGKSIPTSAADRRRCPVLVRAAMVATCPNPVTPAGSPMQAFVSGGITRCSVASTIEIHMRVEQVWEISGQPKLATTDSIVNGVGANGKKMMAGDVSVGQIIANKYGGQCPPGQVRDGTSGECGY